MQKIKLKIMGYVVMVKGGSYLKAPIFSYS